MVLEEEGMTNKVRKQLAIRPKMARNGWEIIAKYHEMIAKCNKWLQNRGKMPKDGSKMGVKCNETVVICSMRIGH